MRDCRSPYCAASSTSVGTYEAYAGHLCGVCEDAAEYERESCWYCDTQHEDENAPPCPPYGQYMASKA